MYECTTIQIIYIIIIITIIYKSKLHLLWLLIVTVT